MLILYLCPSIITGHSAHMEEVTIIPSVGVDTTNSISNSRTGNLRPLTRLSDCEALAPLMAKTLPVALGL